MKIIDILQNPAYAQKNVVEKLLCYKLNLTKEGLFTNSEQEIDPTDLERIRSSYDDYSLHKKPLEYILWFVEFLNVRFEVTPATLIPRPETEYMIIAVNEFIHEQKFSIDDQATIIDVGTWCGVLWLSVLYHNQHKILHLYLSELSDAALHVARKNYIELGKTHEAMNDTPCTFLQADLLDNQILTDVIIEWKPVIIVANLPYIPDETFDENVEDNVKKREPRMAFVGGKDWLDLYRKMFDQLIATSALSGIESILMWTKDAENNLTTLDFSKLAEAINSTTETMHKKLHVTMFLEMMTRQVEILRSEYKNVFTFEEVKTFHFNIRIVKVSTNAVN